MINNLEGEFYYGNSTQDNAIKLLYSTDASVYQEKPMAVAIPKSIEDIKKLIQIARENKTTLIPRAAGTSLAGQVVGNGIVVDISKYFTKIIEVNQAEKWVRVQPGVIRDDLNAFLKPYNLMFGPETSTANRAMIGGMIGNNSCGLHSIVWGATRDNLLEIKGLLSDKSEVEFRDLNEEEFTQKTKQDNLEGKIYRELNELIQNPENQKAIKEGFPKETVSRRNTGYALDYLIGERQTSIGSLGAVVCGSEGTLCFITEAKLKLIDLPPKEVAVVCVHTTTLDESLRANLVALRHHCYASELVDDLILDFTKGNAEQSKNRFFVEGEPKAILMVEFFDNSAEELNKKVENFINELKISNLGYAHPVVYGEDCNRAWNLRKAGLGLLRNLPGDAQPVNLIEDCAVAPEDLPDYIRDLEVVLNKHNLQYSMYAHAGAGELHVEPVINLKTSDGKQVFRTVLAETVELLKKYGGSLSGEHGDGRLRGEFIPTLMGQKNYELFKQVKHTFDPDGVFNRGKITETPPMNEFLRFQQDQPKPQFDTIFDFSKDDSILRLAEKCSGSGDCRKTEVSGGTMCPSYMATRSERDTTRARANILRHYYTQPSPDGEGSLSDGKGVPPSGLEAADILSLCLSCKACKSECPSSVDVAKMKAEFMQEYYDKNGVPFRSKLIANFTKQMKLASIAPFAYNFIVKNDFLRRNFNIIVGFHPDRTMPKLSPLARREVTLLTKNSSSKPLNDKGVSPLARRIFLFIDEFTQYNDGEVGQKMILLLQKLGYEVIIPKHVESGRTYLSKGLVREAKKIAIQNVELLKDLVNDDTPIIGIEPSAILTLRDEYLDLVTPNLKESAEKIAKNTFLFEEWFAREIDLKNIDKSAFTEEKRLIKVHGHCHQKALSSMTSSKKTLSLPTNYEVHMIPSGCCGMAGSFGYEKEHYEVSMKIGELVLFPTVRKQAEEVIIAAAGTSCRHQIKDGTGRIAKHPAEILFEALK
jgi:FAD/FMN-containing dehydrogenase/Fe-S oxidoreductase